MYKHPRFGKLFSISGVVLFLLLLSFNMYTFPHPPAENGLIDLGPFSGIWALAVNIQAFRSVKWMDEEI